MKQKLLFLFVGLSTILFFACPNPQEEPTPDPVCEANLENVSFGVDTTYNLSQDSVGIDLIWDAIDNVESYTITTAPALDTFVVPGNTTNLSIVQNLPLDALFSATLTAQMSNNATCGPLLLKVNYCNGGATVDDVFRSPDWDILCNDSECEFIRFMSSDIEDCNGNLVDPIPRSYLRGVYFKRADVCDCLTDGGALSVCDGVADKRLNPCLESLPKCLKHDYEPCD